MHLAWIDLASVVAARNAPAEDTIFHRPCPPCLLFLLSLPSRRYVCYSVESNENFLRALCVGLYEDTRRARSNGPQRCCTILTLRFSAFSLIRYSTYTGYRRGAARIGTTTSGLLELLAHIASPPRYTSRKHMKCAAESWQARVAAPSRICAYARVRSWLGRTRISICCARLVNA